MKDPKEEKCVRRLLVITGCVSALLAMLIILLAAS